MRLPELPRSIKRMSGNILADLAGLVTGGRPSMFAGRNPLRTKAVWLLHGVAGRLDNDNNARFESNGERFFLEALFGHFARDPGRRRVLLDVGANKGDYSAVILEQADRRSVPIMLFSFEPTTVSFRKLEQRLGGDPRVTLVAQAASDRSGTAAMYSDREGSPLAALFPRISGSTSTPFQELETVSVVRLDEFIQGTGIEHIDAVKIDTEGNELAVMAGMGEYLRTDFVDFIQFEYGGTYLDSGARLRDVYSLLENRGYRVGKVMPKGIELREYELSMERFRYANYVAVSARVLEAFSALL